MTHLIIIRGLPGSGKSTLARKFVQLGYKHYEADMFFGEQYAFDASLLKEAHGWCQAAVRSVLLEHDVVVSNTFTRIWEMQPYLDMTSNRTIITCEGMYGNIHGVPDEVIHRMRDRWEKYE